jgi:hypothetical protein
MKFGRTAIAAALIAAPIAFAAPAAADSQSTVGCSPCAKSPSISAPGLRGTWEKVWPGTGGQGPWEKALSRGPWEKVWPGKGGQGPWEKAFSGGPWEKVFANAPMP